MLYFIIIGYSNTGLEYLADLFSDILATTIIENNIT